MRDKSASFLTRLEIKMDSTDQMTPEKRRYFRKVIASALVGNMLEFYDLFIYGFLAVYLSLIHI